MEADISRNNRFQYCWKDIRLRSIDICDLSRGDCYARLRTSGLLSGSGGDVTVRMVGDTRDVLMPMSPGLFVPGRFDVVRRAGTTATGVAFSYEDRGGSWSPAEEGGLVWWSSAKNRSNVVSSGVISYMCDWSGANNVGIAEDENPASRPILLANGWSAGVPAVDFSGSKRLWVYNASLPVVSVLNGTSKPFTVAWTGYWKAMSNAYQMTAAWTDAAPSGATSSRTQLLVYGASGPYNKLAMKRRGPGGNEHIGYDTSVQVVNQKARWIQVCSGMGWYVFKNGVRLFTGIRAGGSGGTGSYLTQSNNLFSIGMSLTNAGATVDGSSASAQVMGELSVYDHALTDASVAKLDAYLQEEWPI